MFYPRCSNKTDLAESGVAMLHDTVDNINNRGGGALVNLVFHNKLEPVSDAYNFRCVREFKMQPRLRSKKIIQINGSKENLLFINNCVSTTMSNRKGMKI